MSNEAATPRTRAGRSAAKYDPHWTSTILTIEKQAAHIKPAERYAAEMILNRPYADSDDDAAIVARAVLRLDEIGG